MLIITIIFCCVSNQGSVPMKKQMIQIKIVS